VIALLPVQRDVFIAEAFEALQRKGVVDAFGFLQAQMFFSPAASLDKL
jgi:hypothetical protein